MPLSFDTVADIPASTFLCFGTVAGNSASVFLHRYRAACLELSGKKRLPDVGWFLFVRFEKFKGSKVQGFKGSRVETLNLKP
jgi:hypothetical protein